MQAGNRRLDIQSFKRSLSVFQEGRGVITRLDLSDSISGSRIPRELLIIVSKTNITELYFSGVSWPALKEGDLPPMPSLRTLHIDRSQIASIEEGTFIGFDSLTTLSFRYPFQRCGPGISDSLFNNDRANMLTELPLNLLEPLGNLHFLDISGYKKHEMPNGQLLPLSLPRKFFLHGTKLQEVNFSYKDLNPMPRNFFLGLFKAERVHLRGCGLKFIEYLTFFPLQVRMMILSHITSRNLRRRLLPADCGWLALSFSHFSLDAASAMSAPVLLFEKRYHQDLLIEPTMRFCFVAIYYSQSSTWT
jgi:hypothetical protein